VTVVHLRTWNLSAIWRFDTRGGPVAWLKQVPPFYEHEAAVLRVVADAAPGIVPRLLAAGDHGRMLLADVDGTDRYGAGFQECAAIAAAWQPVQVALVDRVDKLLAHGVPDRRDPGPRIRQVAAARRAEVPGLAELVARLDDRLAAAAACGLPDTLLHGDLHPGNVRSGGSRRVLLDWGDAGVGNPAYDVIRLTGDLPPADAERVVRRWATWWRQAVPGSVPEEAVDLLRPVAALCAAVTYADFLAAIEPTERPYHAADVGRSLAAAVAVAGTGRW
jgi:Phosphotransferase enzyme family